MLSKLFKSRVRFDDSDPGVRRQSVLQIDAAETAALQHDLAELARTDTDPGVRAAAVARLSDVDELAPLTQDPVPEVAAAAAEAIAGLADAGDEQMLSLPGVREATIRLAQNPDAIQSLIAQIDPRHLVRLALESRTARVRLLVAEHVHDEAALVDLERQSRDRDKGVNRLARNRLEQIKQARLAHDEASHRARELAAHLAELEAAEQLPMLDARLDRIADAWQRNLQRLREAEQQLGRFAAVGTAPTPIETFEARLQRIRDALARSRAAETQRDAEAGVAGDESNVAAFESALAELASLVEALGSEGCDPLDDFSSLHERHSSLQQQWLAHADHAPPPGDLAERFHALTHRMNALFEAAEHALAQSDQIGVLTQSAPVFTQPDKPDTYHRLWESQRAARRDKSRIERLLKILAWPSEIPLPHRLKLLQARSAELAAFDQRCHAVYEQLVDQCKQVGRGLEQQVKDGHLNDALGLDAEGKRLLRCLPPGSVKGFQSRFHSLDAQVQELRDWHNFATGPKRRELCEQVEALGEQPLEPKAQADRIKALRRAWNELGPITHYRDRRLLDRFNAAAEKAFEPCRKHFEAQAQARRFNLEQRQVICDELEKYLQHNDWTHPDWKATERILHTAQSEWRKFFPVDRSTGRKTQQRFDELTGQLHARLKEEWGRNIAAKEAVIDAAAKLRDGLTAETSPPGEAVQRAIDEAKALQRRWREIGITPRGVDQRLWKKFRAICDDVFAVRDQAQTQQQQAMTRAVAEAEQLCTDFQHRIEVGDPATADRAELVQFKRDVDALGPLPREAAPRLQRRVRDLEQGYRMLLRDAARHARSRKLAALQATDRALGDIEARLAGGEDRAALARELEACAPTAPDVFAARLTQLRALSAGGEAAGGEAAALADAAARAQAERHRMAIEAELHAGLESPPEDQQRRLELQVERLNRGLRQGTRAEADALALARHWCESGPWTADTGPLSERFFKACERLPS